MVENERPFRTNITYFVRVVRSKVLAAGCLGMDECAAMACGMSELVAGMTDGDLMQRIAGLTDFVRNDPFSEEKFGSRSILDELRGYAQKRELIP